MMILLRLFVIALAAGLITDFAWGQNLVSNPGFDTDVTGWSTGATATIQWDTLDTDSNPASGSALVTNLSTTADDATGARQNITGISGGEYYKMSADILIPGAQSETGRANLLIQWYDQADCAGNVGLFSTSWVTDSITDVWLTSSGTALAPASVQCARLRLTVWKNEDSGTLDAHFDNVRFEYDQVFADSFEACTPDVEGFPDADMDGFGDYLSPPSLFCGSLHYGYVDNAIDCDDTSGDIFPGQVELCDGIDNDCEDGIDEDYLPGGSVTFAGLYPADDGKTLGQDCGAGACAGGSVVCSIDGVSLTCSTESSASVEVCDAVDNDCDGLVDNLDLDGDGYIAAACGGTDCEDGNAAINPGTPEICGDGLDNNCVGGVDEGCLGLGEPCEAPDECETGFCVQQVCCDTACDGPNQSCQGFDTGQPDGTCGIIIN